MSPNLNRPLVLETPVITPDGAGGHACAWVALGTLWAEVQAGRGREEAGAAQVQAVSDCRITLRAAPVGAPSRPRPEQRFRDGTRLFTILAVSERDPDARYLVCTAREEVPA